MNNHLFFLVSRTHRLSEKFWLLLMLKCNNIAQRDINCSWIWPKMKKNEFLCLCHVFIWEWMTRYFEAGLVKKLYYHCIQTGVVFWSHGLSVFVCPFFYSLSISLFHLCLKSLSLFFCISHSIDLIYFLLGFLCFSRL